MEKPHLTILAQPYYPYINECFNYRTLRPSASCPAPGLFIEVIHILSSRLKITAKFVGMDYLEQLSDGNKNLSAQESILNGLRSGQIDLYSDFFDYSTVYGDDFELTAAIFYSETKFVVKRAKTSLRGLMAFFTVYDYKVWLGLLTMVVLFTAIGCFIYFAANNIEEKKRFGNIIWSIARLQLMQNDSRLKERLLSFNALILVFGLLNCGLLVQMYNSLITSQAVRQIDPEPFKENEITRVLRDKSYSLIFPNKFRWVYQDIINSSEPKFYEIRQAVANNPIRLAQEDMQVKSLEAENFVLDLVKKGGWITILTDEMLETVKNEGYCNFVGLKTGFVPKSKHFLMRKNHTLLPAIDKVIVEEAVLIRRLHNKYYKYARPACDQPKSGPRALGIISYYAVLGLVGVGFIFGTFSFLLELWMKNKRK